MSLITARDIDLRPIAVLAWNFAAAQVVVIGASSAASTAISEEAVRLCATADCWVKVDANPTASAAAGSAYLAAGRELVLAGTAGKKVAVIQVNGAGSLSILPAATA